MLQLIEFYSKPCNPCGYYDDRYSHFRYFFIQNCSKAFCQALIERGYRRFGEYFFTPMCADCSECLSIRQRVGGFVLSKSHRRIIAKNTQTTITIARPSLSDEKLQLYNQYHQIMEEKRAGAIRKCARRAIARALLMAFATLAMRLATKSLASLWGWGILTC